MSLFKLKPAKLVMTVLLLMSLLSLTKTAFPQGTLSLDNKLNVSGNLSITNNGISIVPALGLGKPATLFNLSVGKRFRFEPEMDFSIDGKPWQYLFWFRYDLINNGHLLATVGANTAYLFRTVPALIKGQNQSKDIIQVRQVLGSDLNARYTITNNFNIGFYYLYGYGFQSSVPTYTDYLSVYSSISPISLFSDLYMDLRPQIYYLKIDAVNGFYLATDLTLGLRDIPVTISSTVNKIIDSTISGNADPLWDVSLNYSFRF
jgi:hypothetical protein